MNGEILVKYTRPAKPAVQGIEVSTWWNEAALGAHREVLDNREFFARKSLAELADEQGVHPIKDISVFAGGFPEDEDLDELLAELERLRRI
jgi:hypothetical protein